MNKKSWLLIILTVLFLIVLGIIIWEFFQTKKLQPSAQTITRETPQPQYPQVESFRVPILMYHYIRGAEGETELGRRLSVSPGNFENQVKWLKDENYLSLKMTDLADPQKKTLSKIAYEKKKPIVLTFDDGYEDAYTQALPVLKKYGFTATFYVISNYLGWPNYLNENQIEELKKAGMEIGSHTLTHPDLTKISLEEARRQIFESKGDVQTFCYPAGRFNETVVNLVKEAGYQTAVTTKFGIATEKSDLFELPRVRVEEGSGETLKYKIEAAYEQSGINP